MIPLAQLWSHLCRASLGGGLCLVAQAVPNPSRLAVHLQFTRGSHGELVCRDAVTAQSVVVREGRWIDGAAEFAGKPAQGIALGAIALTPPMTVVFWLKRAAQAEVQPEGRELPEYLQEYGRQQGRLLGADRGNPAEMSGSLRIGPERLEVWQGKERRRTLIPGPIPAARWVHVAVVYSPALEVVGYLDGKKGATVRGTCDFRGNSVSLLAPALERRFGYPLAGRVGEVRIYHGALSAGELAALAAQRPAD